MYIELDEKLSIKENCPKCGRVGLVDLHNMDFNSLCGQYFIQYFYWFCYGCDAEFKLKKVTKYEKEKALTK